MVHQGNRAAGAMEGAQVVGFAAGVRMSLVTGCGGGGGGRHSIRAAVDDDRRLWSRGGAQWAPLPGVALLASTRRARLVPTSSLHSDDDTGPTSSSGSNGDGNGDGDGDDNGDAKRKDESKDKRQDGSLGSLGGDSREMRVFRRSGVRRPGGELYFDVSVMTPPRRYLGRFQLDPHTHCGDIVEHEGLHFEVKVVKMKYRFKQGQFSVIGKSLEVKSLARKALEVYLERTFEQS